MYTWTIIPNHVNELNSVLTVVGFGKDYMLATISNGCPRCNSVENTINKIFPDVKCVFVMFSGSCVNGAGENRIWIDEEVARKIFPPYFDGRWYGKKFPETFAEVKELLTKK